MVHLWNLQVIVVLTVFLSACNFVSQPEVPTPEPTPKLGNIYEPQGTPTGEWKEIPIMPQATDGQEFIERNSYSFKTKASVKEVQDFYHETLTTLGWRQPYDIPVNTENIFFFQKDKSILTITAMPSEKDTLVMLDLGQ